MVVKFPVVKTYFVLILMLLSFNGKAWASNRGEFYKLIATGSLDEINKAIANFEQEKGSLYNAYRGALLMKKAHFLKAAGQKLNVFKKGAKLLDSEIANHSENAEYRFLRLIIQEKAPKILNYRKEIEQDKAVILQAFPKLTSDLKNEIKNYSKKSKSVLTDHLQ